MRRPLSSGPIPLHNCPNSVFGVVLILVDFVLVIVDISLYDRSREVGDALEAISLLISFFFLADVLLRVYVEGWVMLTCGCLSVRLLQPCIALWCSSGETTAFCKDLCHVKLIICRRSLSMGLSHAPVMSGLLHLNIVHSHLHSQMLENRLMQTFRRFCISRINIVISRKL